MDVKALFFDKLSAEMAVTLATSDENGVHMRLVSPVCFDGGILIFTLASSSKYIQLKADSRCCIGFGAFFAEAEASFLGKTVLPENAGLRKAYESKFPGAFDEGIEFGGRNAEFVLLRVKKLSGWTFADGSDESGIPSVPFEIEVESD